MSQLLDQLTRNITTTEVWLGLFFFLLLGVGLCLLGRGLGFAFHFDGWIPKIEWISNEALKPRSHVVLSLIGIGLFVPGLIGLNWLTSVTSLEVLLSLSEEEYAQFRILEKKFNEEHEGEQLRIRSDNVEWSDLVRRLKQTRIDVIIFDVTRRLELLREDLLKPLDDRRRLIPSSINPILLDDMSFNERLYFLPFRPNVRIGWWNSHHPTARACAPKSEQTESEQTESEQTKFEQTVLNKTQQDVKEFVTWQDVKEFVKPQDGKECAMGQDGKECAMGQDGKECVKPQDRKNPEARFKQYKVVLSANGAEWTAASEDGDEIDPDSPPPDAALLLLEVLMASGKKPWQVCESWWDEKNEKNEKKEDAPLNVLRDIYLAASPRSSDTDWQTATGHLLSRHVALARNWSISIATMRDSGKLQYFHPHVAWAWKGDGEKEDKNRFRTLLGGDVIALPQYGRQGDAVYKLLRFLISKDAQKILVEGPSEKKEGLTWPPMRFDVGGITDSEDEELQDTKESQKEAQDDKGNKPSAKNPGSDAKTPLIVDTSSPQLIGDEQCHGTPPPTGKIATDCARLHLYMARNVVREAMLYAAPTPRFWSPEMHESFTSAFQALVSTENEEEVASKLEEAAGLYCLAPGGKTSEDKQGEQDKKKLSDFITLRFEGYPNATLNDVLDPPRIRVKLVKAKDEDAKDEGKAVSYHTDLCVQLDSNNHNLDLPPIRIPAGFTSELSEPVSALLFRAVKINKGEAWELKDPDAQCDEKLIASLSKSKVKPTLVSETPLTVVVLPFTSLVFLVLGILIGMFFKPERQQCLLNRLWKMVRAPFTSLRRGLQVVLFILVVQPLWFTLERLEYAEEVCRFFSDAPVQVWLIPLALLLGFVLEMVVEQKIGAFKQKYEIRRRMIGETQKFEQKSRAFH